LLRANGEDIKVQQELMCHADVGTTMNLYTQAISSDKRDTQEKIVEIVLNGNRRSLPRRSARTSATGLIRNVDKKRR
jgi:hypothetical protein